MINFLKPYFTKLHSCFGYEVFVMSSLLLFALLVDSNKWFANAVYISCLLPALYYLRQGLRELKDFEQTFFRLFIYGLYVSVVLLFDGLGFETIKYFFLLILFFCFIYYRLYLKSQMIALYTAMLVICTVFMLYGVWDAGASTGGRYDFAGLNANRLSLLFVLPSAWFFWYAFAQDKAYKYGASLVFFMSVLADFYLLGSRSLLFFVFVYILFFAYEFGRLLTARDFKWFSAISVLLILCVLYFYDFFYQRVMLRGGSYRLDIWQDALDRMRAESCYLYGCGKQDGYQFLNMFDNPHGIYSSTLYYYGLFGAVLLLFFLYACFKEVQGFYRAWFAACLVYFVFTHVELLASPSIFWLYFWMPLFMGFLDKRGCECAMYSR